MTDNTRDRLIGLGESSFRKSYYPELQRRNKELSVFKHVFDKTNDFISIVDIGHQGFMYVNQAFCIFFNIIESRYSDLKPKDVLGEELWGFLSDYKSQDEGAKRLFEIEIKQKHYFLEADLSVVSLEGKEYVISVLRDITDYMMVQNNLKELNAHIIAQNEELEKRNKEIAEINDDLLLAKNKAEESDQLKTAFLQNMSHEIRTPMNGIFGFAELIKQPGLEEGDIQTFADTIFSGAKQLLAVVDNIINISTIATGQEKLNYSWVEMHLFFREIIALFSNIANEKGIEIGLTEHLPVEELWTDEVKLKQVFINLIGNAIKFTEEGSVHIHVAYESGNLKMCVEDTGTGIPNEMHDVIFERFRQADTEGSRKMGGTGLGLAISKAYVEMLGGNIFVNSKIGQGSTFYFTHPVKEK